MHRQATEFVWGKAAAVVLALAALLSLTASGQSPNERSGTERSATGGSLEEAARQQAEAEGPALEESAGSAERVGSEEPVAGAPELPAFADDPEVDEPDYAEVAADARGIVAEIEERLIEAHMTDGARELSAGDGVEGHPYVEEAHVDMKEMIKFCESTSGGAGKACKFKLEIRMGMGMGSTLSQLAKGMNPGADGTGGFGQGSGGQGGSSAQFGLYGGDPFGEKTQQSRSLGTKKVKDVDSLGGPPDPLAGDIEELSSSKNEDLRFSTEGDEGVMEEYRPLIEEYFKRMAEED